MYDFNGSGSPSYPRNPNAADSQWPHHARLYQQLLSLGKLCDADCTATMDKHTLEVHDKYGQKILHGDRELRGACLWRVNIAPQPTPTTPPTNPPTKWLTVMTPPPIPAATPAKPPPPWLTITTPPPLPAMQLKPQSNATHREVRTLDLPNTPALIAYHHATAGYPVKQTWLDAIQRGAYKTWPGVTYKLIARHCPDSDEML